MAPASKDTGPAIAAPVDPLRPDVRVDLDDRSATLDLWSRVRRVERVELSGLDVTAVYELLARNALYQQIQQQSAARREFLARPIFLRHLANF